jgi:hypothetical protein
MRLVPVILVVLVGAAFTVGANSGGAPAGAAVDGCTCHAAEPSSSVTVTLDGVPETFVHGEPYGLTVTVAGPDPLPDPLAQNQGGYQLIASAGDLAPASNQDGQNINETAMGHSSSTNDQRVWSVIWTAPIDPTITHVMFWYAGNAVNGDTREVNDAWNKGTAMSMAAGGDGNGTGNETTPAGGDSAAGSVILTAGAMTLAVAAAMRLRRTR